MITMAEIGFNKQYLDTIRDAYKKAPYAGIGMGVLKGLPRGLVAGGLTYGALSLFPPTRKKRMLKAIFSLLAAGAADAYVAVPEIAKERDNYFKSKTSLPSPWKTYEFRKANGDVMQINPNDTFAQAKGEMDKSLNTLKTEWNNFKTSPAAYIASGIK